MDSPAPGRDDQGRFSSGNAGGPGRPRGKGFELQRAAQDAVTADHMRAMMRKALMMALGGNLAAMRFVAERALGRAPEAPAEGSPVDVSLPKLKTIDDCLAALDKVNDAMVRGDIALDAVKVLTDVIHVRVKAIEVRDIEKRLTELEKAAESVDFGGRGGRRF